MKETPYRAYAGKSIMHQMWDELDHYYKEMVENKMSPEETARYQGICRGLAISLHKTCKPEFKTVDDVAREAARRYELRDST